MTERTGNYFLDQSEAIGLAHEVLGGPLAGIHDALREEVAGRLDAIAVAIEKSLTSPDDLARWNGKPATVAGGMFAIARAIERLAIAVENQAK